MPPVLAPWTYPELQAWLRLLLTPGVGHRTAQTLLRHFGSPEAIFAAPLAALSDCTTLAQAHQLRQTPASLDALCDHTWQWLHSASSDAGRALLTIGDPRYPDGLLQIPDPPLLLYVLGPPQWLARPEPLCTWQRSLAMVGSRNPTPQGADHAYQFALHLAQQGWCIVSGMALGVDARAHEGALACTAAQQPTIAVVGTGIDRIYPRAHQALAQRLARHGLIISEFPLGTPPIASNFPRRNRIISGLSRGTLVVEAALASGSLITARTAVEQGREVFAIPGSIHSPLARGCHVLIQQGAKLVQSAQDILDECGAPAAPTATAAIDTSAVPAHAPVPEPHVLQAMGYDPIHLDTLCARTGEHAASVQAQLLELELSGQVTRLPGGLFQRCGQA